MMALALLTLSLMAIIDITSGAMRNHAMARELTTATMLARAKMVELEQKYEDEGFKDFDENLDGDFEPEGHPEFKWKADIVQPDVDLSPEQLMGMLAGAASKDDSSSDLVGKIMGKLMGGGGQSGAAGVAGAAGAAGAAASPLAGMLQGQLTAFGDTLKKALREVRLTVAWRDGSRVQEINVATHLVVFSPKAPGGTRGDAPDLPPGAPPPGAPGTVPPGATPPPGPFPGGAQLPGSQTIGTPPPGARR